MMTPPRMTLLLASDGSAGSLAAARWVAQHYAPEGTKLVVLVVAEWFNISTGYGPVALPDFLEDVDLAAYQRGLEQTVEILSGFEVESVLKQGEPVATIIHAIDDVRPDLLVAGHRGLHGLSSVLLGSVAQALVHRSPIPVLIVPQRAGPGDA